jgi:glutamate formiminotransferase
VRELPLLTVPNVSEGRDAATITAIGRVFEQSPTRLLDVHTDPDHHRSVFSAAGRPGQLAPTLRKAAQVATERIDLRTPRGLHPHVGAVDVVPIVHLDKQSQGSACAEALMVADLIAHDLGIPVFVYGALAGGRTRAELRRGGLPILTARMRTGELRPDFGPTAPHPSAGATLVAARPPLVAFNLELAAPATLETAREIARRIREGGSEGLPGLRAIGLQLAARADVAQLSMNVENPHDLPLRTVVEVVRRHAEPITAEIVGLAPRAALEGFPADLPIPGFDPARHLIEDALGL